MTTTKTTLSTLVKDITPGPGVRPFPHYCLTDDQMKRVGEGFGGREWAWSPIQRLWITPVEMPVDDTSDDDGILFF